MSRWNPDGATRKTPTLNRELVLDLTTGIMEPSARGEAPGVFACLSDRHALQRARLMVIVAHPDDEVVGAGARLPNLKSSMFIHVTTGAGVGCAREASRRFSELVGAFEAAGLSKQQLQPIGRPDQSLSHSLFGLTRQLASLITETRPEALLTHPYEGGHPDHDAIAFAVMTACRTIARPPPIVEMAFYHQGARGICTGKFLPDDGTPTMALQLSSTERDLKKSLLNCFPSQAQMLRHFELDTELFRIAPAYDFTQPPHAGRLFYENFDWGIRSSAQWRTLAREALAELESQK
jgi:LmbE family N-acetylglucosaminyl deacetylase